MAGTFCATCIVTGYPCFYLILVSCRAKFSQIFGIYQLSNADIFQRDCTAYSTSKPEIFQNAQ